MTKRHKEPRDPAIVKPIEETRAAADAFLAAEGMSSQEVQHRQAFVAAVADAMSHFLYGSTFEARHTETFDRAAKAALFRLDEDGYKLPQPRQKREPRNVLERLVWKLGFKPQTLTERIEDGMAEQIRRGGGTR